MNTTLSVIARVRGEYPTKCDWCGESIDSGDPYLVESQACDGSVYSLHMHVECFIAGNDSHDPHEDGIDMTDAVRGLAIDAYGDHVGDRQERVARGVEWWIAERARHATSTATVRAYQVAHPYKRRKEGQ